MPKFTQKVIETRTYEVMYVVEALNEAEAADKIATGETIKETEIRLLGVQERDPSSPLERI